MATQPTRSPGIVWRELKDGAWHPYVRLYIDGRQRLFTPPQPTITSARALYQKLKTQYREGTLDPSAYHHGTLVLVAHCIARYQTTLHQKRTATGEQVFASWWLRWYAKTPVRAVTVANLEKARAALLAGQWAIKDRPRSPSRVNRYTQWLHQVFQHPINRPLFPSGNPVSLLKKFEEPEPPVLWATHEQEAQLAAELDRETPGSPAWLRLAVITGMRQGEQFGCPKSRVDLAAGLITIPRPKASKRPRYVVLTPEAHTIVAALLQSPGPWLIPDPADPSRPFPIKTWYKTKYRRALRRVGLPEKFTWHSLRHTWASRMIDSGADSRLVQEGGGWSSPRMVQRYAHVRAQRLRDAMAKSSQPIVPDNSTQHDRT